MKNRSLQSARRAKNDEFYTQLSDIEKELRHYSEHFRGKTVYCNCDDPRSSGFFHYFAYNFGRLGLKRLIATCYRSRDVDGFSEGSSVHGIYQEYHGEMKGDLPDLEKIEIRELEGDGDFRSPECIELLLQADIVCTNPPFSLFREYVAQLVEHNKEFLIIGSMNAITYKEIFPLIKDNRVWYGPSIHSGDREFEVPDSYPLKAAGFRVGPKGEKYIRVKGVRWFTNLDSPKRHEDLILYRAYYGHEEDYPTYDNYDAINVNKVRDIPCDYWGVMGVPITFLDKYSPGQFEILGLTDRKNTSGLRTQKYTREHSPRYNDLNARSVIKTSGTYKAIYARILIRRRRQQ
jgi:hypothetical protein